MTPRWTVYRDTVSDYRDEETLNDCVADLIDDSLARGPSFLNFLLHGLVEFDNDARVMATDREPLPFRPDGTDRKIDFTIADTERIVGFESKRRDNLSEGQLLDEHEKLAYNADGRTVMLVAITEHLSEPGIISRLPDDIHRLSWYALSQRVFDAASLDEGWQPTVSRAQSMFREFGYSDFGGIDDEEFRVSVWELWKQIAAQVDGLATGQRWPYNMLTEVAGESKGWEPIDPDWMMLTYGEESGTRPSKTSYTVLSNKKTRDVWIGIALHPHGNEALRDFMCDHAETLSTRVSDENLEVIQFPINWLVGRKNLPEDHRKAVTAAYPSTQEELSEAFSNRRGMKNDGANRFVLGYRLSSSDVLEESVDYIHRLKGLFGGDHVPEIQRLLG